MRIETMSATGFLEASYKAAANSAARPAFKEILQELSRSPAAKQKLVFELLTMIPRLIDSRQDPSEAFLWGTRWRRSIEAPNIPEYLALLEDAVVRYFEAIRSLPVGVDIHPWVLPLGLGLTAIGELDTPRYTRVLNALRQRCGNPAMDPRKRILEAAISDGEERE